MAKSKTVFFCRECGYESAKWVGQCPACKSWDTMSEGAALKKGGSGSAGESLYTPAKPQALSLVDTGEDARLFTGIAELDRVLGGGVVNGSLILVGGDPGIGKSTLLLQMCRNVSAHGRKVLYVSGEESLRQIRMRADRLGTFQGDPLLLCETDLDEVEAVIRREQPQIVIIDSIQTMFKEETGSAPGSVSQVRESTSTLLRLAKTMGVTIFIIGHVTKEGVVAGPRMLEHMVDTVLYFEGESGASYRILRAAKNRFGPTNEVGVFEMRREGLAGVENPSEYMLSGKPKGEPGSAVACSMEGTRPILIEIQALVCRTFYNMPRRTASGADYNRVGLLMAVIEKRLGYKLSECDAYVNVAGGMKIAEPALDLALVAVILSSYKNRPLDERVILFGEVGLTGEVRAVTMAGQRIAEAEKMGFTLCILPKANAMKSEELHKQGKKIELVGISNIKEILDYI